MTAKRIFITGASTGLGRAAAILFAERGWRVVATARQVDTLRELGAAGDVTALTLDVTVPAQIDAAVKATLEGGGVDVVFCNAGYGLAGPFEGASDEQLVHQLDTNLLGVMRVTRAFLPSLREQRSGTIITTTSIGGHVTFPFNSVYHATKWALEGWSESLAYELAGFGIRVKTVAPGGISTDFAGRSLVLTQHPAYAEPMARTLAAFSDPARRAGYSTATQIAEVVYTAATDERDQVSYLAGADAEAIHGQRKAAGVDAFRAAIRDRFFG